MTNQISRQILVEAIAQPGFENWRPTVDVPELHRPNSRPPNLEGDGLIAAVLLLIFPPTPAATLLESTLVLTKRHAKLSKHANQISFPGGRQDRGESLRQTAIRETSEEIGVEVSDHQILGQLNNVYIPPSDFTVTPFVGWIPNSPEYVRSEAEVDEVIEASVEHLLNPTTLIFDHVDTSNGRTEVPLFKVGKHQVWGATAIMISELLERIRRSTGQ